MSKTKILMVCLGNICRSPLAEGILRDKLDITQFEVDSVGTGDWHIGDPPDHRSINIGKQRGTDISMLRGRQITHQDLVIFDHIYVMDQNNLEDVKAMAKTEQEQHKITMILDEVFPGERVDVPDPYQGSLEDFERVYEMLDRACEEIAKKIQ